MKENKKSKGICPKCKKLVNTTFKYSDYRHKRTIIENVLQSFCDECGTSIGITNCEMKSVIERYKNIRKENDRLKRKRYYDKKIKGNKELIRKYYDDNIEHREELLIKKKKYRKDNN